MRSIIQRAVLGAFFVVTALQVGACSDSGSEKKPGPWYEPDVGTSPRIAYDMGVLDYLNKATPKEVLEWEGHTAYTFDRADGPSCMRGREYSVTVRDTGSEDLLLFMQGGGACWSAFCLAVKVAPKGIPTSANILNPKLADNPARDWNVVYMPYCDGSLFVGDNTIIEEDGKERIHAGLHNTSAALSIAHQRFPKPKRILLAGSSGGGFGTIMVGFIVRYIWPDTPLFIMNDSGVGIAHDGDRSFIDTLIDEFGARKFLPADCPTCGDNGHITDLVDYFLERDDNVKIGVFSSWYDGIIADMFLQVDPDLFQQSMARVTGALHDEHPESYRRFIINGNMHTSLLGDATGIIGRDITGVELPKGIDMMGMLGNLLIGTLNSQHKNAATLNPKINGITIGQWIEAMLNDGDQWLDLQDEPVRDPAPPEGEGETVEP